MLETIFVPHFIPEVLGPMTWPATGKVQHACRQCEHTSQTDAQTEPRFVFVASSEPSDPSAIPFPRPFDLPFLPFELLARLEG